MALLWGMSRLLAVDEEELRSRVHWANLQTFAPFLTLYHSVAPVLRPAHSSEILISSVIDDFSPPCTCPLTEQLLFSQVQIVEQNQEQLDSAALSPACPSVDPASRVQMKYFVNKTSVGTGMRGL
jgi:hypothetical protein